MEIRIHFGSRPHCAVSQFCFRYDGQSLGSANSHFLSVGAPSASVLGSQSTSGAWKMQHHQAVLWFMCLLLYVLCHEALWLLSALVYRFSLTMITFRAHSSRGPLDEVSKGKTLLCGWFPLVPCQLLRQLAPRPLSVVNDRCLMQMRLCMKHCLRAVFQRLWHLFNHFKTGVWPMLANCNQKAKHQEMTQPHSSRKLLHRANKLTVLEKARYVLALYGSFQVLNHIRAIGYSTNFLQQSASLIDDIALGKGRALVKQCLHLPYDQHGSDKALHHCCRACGHSVLFDKPPQGVCVASLSAGRHGSDKVPHHLCRSGGHSDSCDKAPHGSDKGPHLHCRLCGHVDLSDKLLHVEYVAKN